MCVLCSHRQSRVMAFSPGGKLLRKTNSRLCIYIKGKNINLEKLHMKLNKRESLYPLAFTKKRQIECVKVN